MTTRIASGERTHRVALRAPTEVTGTHGEITRTYATSKTVWGRVKQLSGKEAEVARQIQPTATHEVVIPYESTLTVEYQFLIRSLTFGIVSIDNRDLADVELVCLCEEAK